MKVLLIVVSSFFAMSAAHAEDYSLKSLTCSYKSEVSGKILKPITTWSKAKGTKKAIIAMAYIVKDGKKFVKVIEKARVTSSLYVDGFDTYAVKAITDSGKKVVITIYADLPATWKIDGVFQDYIEDLSCDFVTNG